ncbi:MAG TPA: cation diffusion facilitator family transporter [Dissulfurispiraceae bacterium]|nr:cation diffusion facilitator family transporter [Dissulfurispiraceae bacterium]
MGFNHRKENVALNSIIASFLLAVMKLVVGIVTGSIGIISEAAHSGVDFGAVYLTYFAVRVSDKPADREHQYGHTKVESVVALIETGVLLLTSGWIIYAAVQRLLSRTSDVRVAWYSVGVLVISMVVDFSRSRMLKKAAIETRSQALEADALHFSSDILSSAVVLVGLIFVASGVVGADALAAIAVALMIAYAAVRFGKKTVDVLIDAAPEGLTDQIAFITRGVEGVIKIEKIRVKPAGPFAFVEMTLDVSRTLSLENVQSICSSIEEKIRELLPVADITIHTKPIALDCETIGERIHVIGANHNLHVHNISSNIVEEKKHISFDVEVEHNLTIKEAHEVVSNLEREIRREFDGDLDISVHIDPLRSEERRSQAVSPDEEAALRKIIIGAAGTIDRIREVHHILIRKTETEKLFITLHCSFEDGVLLEDVHSITSKFEGLIYQTIPNAGQVIIHAEPLFAKD